mmetsp:Transcript_15425/g.48478  ORF Transcript_15425/g.48478 Transcript_15425/m.48478 type:complete len:334 (+) Transcript_15425:485-1486(+)
MALLQAQLPGAQLEVNQNQQIHGHVWQQTAQQLEELDGGLHLLRRVHRPHEDARPISYVLLAGDAHEALNAPHHVRLHLRRRGVVVPEAAAPARGLVDFQFVLLVGAHRAVGEEVLEVRLQAVHHAPERGPQPVKGVGSALQANSLQGTRHTAEVPQTDELAALGEGSRHWLVQAKPGPPGGDFLSGEPRLVLVGSVQDVRLLVGRLLRECQRLAPRDRRCRARVRRRRRRRWRLLRLLLRLLLHLRLGLWPWLPPWLLRLRRRLLLWQRRSFDGGPTCSFDVQLLPILLQGLSSGRLNRSLEAARERQGAHQAKHQHGPLLWPGLQRWRPAH